MNTKRKIVVLAAVPLTAILAGGGVAAAWSATDPPAGRTHQHTAVRHTDDPAHGITGTTTTRTTPSATACHDGNRADHGDHHSAHRPGTTPGDETAEHRQPGEEHGDHTDR